MTKTSYLGYDCILSAQEKMRRNDSIVCLSSIKGSGERSAKVFILANSDLLVLFAQLHGRRAAVNPDMAGLELGAGHRRIRLRVGYVF